MNRTRRFSEAHIFENEWKRSGAGTLAWWRVAAILSAEVRRIESISLHGESAASVS
jgi:hypothetical protein